MILTSFKGVAKLVAIVLAWLVVLNIFNRPSVAGDVLHTPVIQSLIQLSFFSTSSKHNNAQTVRVRTCNFATMFTTSNVSGITCQDLHITW